MQPIKVLSLYLFLISSFSYAEQGVYMLVSRNLTEEQVSAIEETTDYKAIGYFNSPRQRIAASYPKEEEDFEGMEGLSSSYGMEKEQTNGTKFLSGFSTFQLGFGWETEGTKSLEQSIEEINVRAREIHEATKKYGIYAIMRDSGFFQGHTT